MTKGKAECERTGYNYTVGIDCPATGSPASSFVFECPGVTEGFHNFTCPLSTRLPVCLTWDGLEYSPDMDCEVVLYDESATKCRCNATSSDVFSNRRTQASRGHYVMDVAASAMDFHYDFSAQYTIRPIPIIQYDTQLYDVLYYFTTVVVLVLVLFGGYDLTDGRSLGLWTIQKNPKRERAAEEFFASVLPTEVAYGDWYHRWWKQMQHTHSLLRLFAPIDQESPDSQGRGLRWFSAAARMAVLVSVATGFQLWFYADDGACESFLDQETCLAPTAIDGIGTQCTWNVVQDFCTLALLETSSQRQVWLMHAMCWVLVCAVPFHRMADRLAQEVAKPNAYWQVTAKAIRRHMKPT